jgi:hypothetical protein
MKKLLNKWNLLYFLLAAIILFSIFGIPKIAAGVIAESKGQIIEVAPNLP